MREGGGLKRGMHIGSLKIYCLFLDTILLMFAVSLNLPLYPYFSYVDILPNVKTSYVFGPKRAGALCRIWCTVSQRKNHERSEGRVLSAAGDLLRIMWPPFLPSSMQLQLSKLILAAY